VSRTMRLSHLGELSVDRNHFATLLVIENSKDIALESPRMQAGIEHMLEFLESAAGLNSVSMVEFADGYQFVNHFDPPGSVRFKFSPHGRPALWDSLCNACVDFANAIQDLPEHTRPARVQVVIIASGRDSSSTFLTEKDTRTIAGQLMADWGWDFRHFSVGPGARALGGGTGFLGEAFTSSAS